MYTHIMYISYILLCTQFLRVVRGCGSPSGPWTAKLGSKLDLYCQVGLPSGPWASSWAAKAHFERILGSKWAPTWLPSASRSAPDLQFCSTVWHFSNFF